MTTPNIFQGIASLATFVLICSFGAQKSEAATFTGFLSITNGVSYTFTETLTTAAFTLTGGAIALDESITIIIPGTEFWNVSGGITLDADIDDEIRLNVDLLHKSQPHPEDVGNGATYTSSLVLLAEDGANDSSYTVTGSGSTLDHDLHEDNFFNEKITATIDTTPIIDIDDIDSWSYTLNAKHLTPEPIPEPTSILGILALSALGGGSLLKRKRQQMNKVKI